MTARFAVVNLQSAPVCLNLRLTKFFAGSLNQSPANAPTPPPIAPHSATLLVLALYRRKGRDHRRFQQFPRSAFCKEKVFQVIEGHAVRGVIGNELEGHQIWREGVHAGAGGKRRAS